LLSHQRGKKTRKTKKTKMPQSVPSSNTIHFQEVFQYAGVVLLLSHRRKTEKETVWRQLCECLSEAAAHLPTAVSLLWLHALFMQVSGVSLTLT
jgi:hypothetical protein